MVCLLYLMICALRLNCMVIRKVSALSCVKCVCAHARGICMSVRLCVQYVQQTLKLLSVSRAFHVAAKQLCGITNTEFRSQKAQFRQNLAYDWE